MLNSEQKKVVVGLSGGVDSAVSAHLLKAQGYDVTALFMQNWEAERDDPYCTAEQDLSDARAICDQLDIRLETVNFSQAYWDNVFEYCLDEFSRGRTPNPDIWCNREIKFKVFLERALQEADALATGHYARIEKTGNHYALKKGLDPNKDQTYFLYTLGQEQLKNSLFPVGSLHKSEVRKIAQAEGFINFEKKDSTGICFIGERKFKDFLKNFLLAQPGNIETPEGKIIGKHDGIMFYTLGQRKGLAIGGRRDASEDAWYVLAKDVKRNVLIAGQGHDHPLLYSQSLSCQNLHWVADVPPQTPLVCRAKTRYRQADQACVLTEVNKNHYQVEFEVPQRAITPGQSIVFYQEDNCLGGGIID